MSQIQKDADKFASLLHYVADCINYAHQIQRCNDCNTCQRECKHKPKPGQLTRINCFDWEGKTT